MRTRLNSILRSSALATLLVALALPASAQAPHSDARWQPWLGCWTPAGTLVRVIGKTAEPVVCVVPTSTASAVDVMTASGGKILDRTRVDADGRPHAVTKEGCSGTQTATWSPSARRLYLESEYVCKDAPATHVSALYAMAGSGEWIDVQGMRVDKNVGVHAVRYRENTDAGSIPAEIARQLPARSMARSAAMLAASAPPSLSDVEEAAHKADPGVVSTWLIEEDKVAVETPAPLGAKQLEQLADNGVPGSVIDVMVGLSYPKVFAVNPANRAVARQNADSAYAQYGRVGSLGSYNPVIGFDGMGFPIYASESAMMYGCSPFEYGPYGAAWNLYNARFGCGGYGYAYGSYLGYGGYYGGYPYSPYYGGYFGGGPVVVPIVTGSPATGTVPHGRVVNGRGYVQGRTGSNGNASPRSGDVSPSNRGGGSAAPSASPPPAPAPPPARTAQPRKP